MQPTVAAPTYQQNYDQLNSVYDPQRAVVNQQIAGIDPQVQAQTDALNQAKVNAFKDITNSANSKGVLFSGVPVDQQSTYVGTKYLPAIAGLQSQANSQKLTLQQALNTIGEKQSGQATTQLNGYLDAQAKQQAAQYAADTAAEARIQAAQIAAASRASSRTPADPTKGFTTKQDKAGGTQFFGAGNAPITAAQYYAGTGGTVNNLAQFLQNDSNSKNAYNDLAKNNFQITDALIQKYPYIFGGV